MIDEEEIVSTLTPLNGIYFEIHDLMEYAKKVTTHGKAIDLRQEHSHELISYVLYYDNGPEIFITMVWTSPEHQGQGFAEELLQQLIRSSTKNIKLEVHEDNPALRLYENVGFVVTRESGDVCVMSLQRKIAIMQPYIFPNIGYFHLIDASDVFVFYDDVHYIKRGWINRNRILLNGKDYLFSVPVSRSSQNRLINETLLSNDREWNAKFTKTLTHSYQNAPFFASTMEVVTAVFSTDYCNISDMAIDSIARVCDYLEMEFNYTRSSVCLPEPREIDKADRLIEITKRQGSKHYVNAAGGVELYTKDYFLDHGVELTFIQSKPVEYEQYENEFVPGLSIIDVMMFNSVETTRGFIARYKVN